MGANLPKTRADEIVNYVIAFLLGVTMTMPVIGLLDLMPQSKPAASSRPDCDTVREKSLQELEREGLMTRFDECVEAEMLLESLRNYERGL